MRIDVLTLFPEMFTGVLGSSILKRAAEEVKDPKNHAAKRQPVASYHVHDIRDWSTDKHGKVDQAPFGGGPGMVMQCQPVWDSVQAVEAMDSRAATRILMTPQGRPLTQKLVEELATKDRLLLIAGHYEGIDERVIDALAPLEISIGDYVLSGGELPAMVLIDAVVRLIPGAVGDSESTDHESFSASAQGMLDYPHYTRPREWMGREAPAVLLSGNHAAIEKWRQQQSLERTAARRPDLLSAAANPPASPDKKKENARKTKERPKDEPRGKHADSPANPAAADIASAAGTSDMASQIGESFAAEGGYDCDS